jgi:ABC-type molybdate transport system ATPase subunit
LTVAGTCEPNARVALCIRPERVELGRASAQVRGSEAANNLEGRVTLVEQLGPLLRVTLDVGFQLVAFVPPAAAEELALAVGRPIAASISAAAIHPLDLREPGAQATESLPRAI